MTDSRRKDGAGQRAAELFGKEELYCAESVLQALAEENGVTSPLIPKIATGLCSGMGRTGGMCGALSGGVLGLSMMLGRAAPSESVDGSYDATQALISAFREKFGETSCLGLLNCDLATPEGQEHFNSNNQGQTHCLTYVRAVADVASKLLKK